jgi:SAM-dependent methyltransferase
VTSDERWLAATWLFVAAGLPRSPCSVLEIGCGPLGGFVPRLREAGYEASGIDPEAPAGPWYRQSLFGPDNAPAPADVRAIVACTSLHHVADLPGTLDLIDASLEPGGTIVVVEWARERFDEATARWCLNRLPQHDPEHADHPGWLQERFARWRESGQSWDRCCQDWAGAEGMHPGADVLDGLEARFETEHLAFGPYFFSDLADTSEADEQAAIDAGLIRATRIQYLGRKRSTRTT